MPAGIVLAGGRSSRMGTPKAWLDWHGAPLLRRVCGLVARGASGPVVVVRAPGQELPPLPDGVRVVEDEREGRGPMQGILAGLRAVDADVAFVASVDLPQLHPRFVAAVCARVDGADAAVPVVDGFRQPLAAAYRAALAPLVAELVDADRSAPRRSSSAARRAGSTTCRTPRACATSTSAATTRRRWPSPSRWCGRAASGRPGAGPQLRAATLGRAAAAIEVELGDHVLAALNGVQVARDPLEPLAEGDDVAFMAADAARLTASVPRMSDRALAERLVRLAGGIALELRGGAVEVKGDATDVVTAADRRAEAALLELLRAERPDDGVVGEEGAAVAGGARRWLLDPVDGTLNYALGLPAWCAAVVVTDAAGALACAAYDPVAGELFSAARGEGATRDGAPLRVGPAPALAEAVVATFVDVRRRDAAVAAGTEALLRRVGALRAVGLRDARAGVGRRRPAARLGPGGRRAVGLASGRAARGRGGRRRARLRALARRRGGRRRSPTSSQATVEHGAPD